MGNWTVKIIDKGYKIARDIYIYRRTFDGTEILTAGNKIKKFKLEESATDEPTLSLEPETLQAFADTLSAIGIKPQQGYLEGKLEATESHLKDMRTLLKLTNK